MCECCQELEKFSFTVFHWGTHVYESRAEISKSTNETIVQLLSMELEQWDPPPRLQSLILHRVTRTNKTIGCGSYGSVEEVAIPGALCAAKKIHDFLTKQDPRWLAKEVAESNVQKFVSECELMSRLQHPHIVQFLGLWWENDSSLHLVMEKIYTIC